MDDPSDSAATSVAADHPGPRGPRRLFLAPTRDGEFHRIRERLDALACWRMGHALFAFDSSLVLPSARQDFAQLAALLDRHPGALLSVFGHADPTGDDGYNKTLSGRRARAVFALLVRDTAAWEELYGKAMPGDTWGTRSLQTMLTLVTPPAGGDPYLTASPSGFVDGPTTKAIKAFQHDHGLTHDGVAGPKTRAVLFRAYMDSLAVGPERQLVLDRSQFLGRGEDPGDRGAVQGCSEFNPLFLLSQSENAAYAKKADHTERDAKNAPNRRVMVLLFAADAPVTAASWPCPRWSEPASGCKPQFWPDGEARRTSGPAEREYRTDRRMMACRWYDQLVRLSPCEGVARRKPGLSLTVWVGAPPDLTGCLEVVDGQGHVIRVISMAQAHLSGGMARFHIAVEGLPDPVTVLQRHGLGASVLFGPCSAKELRDAYLADELDAAAEKALGEE